MSWLAVKDRLPISAGGVWMSGAANINDVLEGHVVLDLECLDRVYLNGYVPKLQVGGQVVTFLPSTLVIQSPLQRCSSASVTASVRRCVRLQKRMASRCCI
jgi:hypothetical protein